MSLMKSYWNECFPSICGGEVVGEFEKNHDPLGHDYCWRCGVNMAIEGVTEYGCAYCKNETLVWDGAYRLSNYNAPVRNWVINLKYKKVWGWSQYLGDHLGRHIMTHPRFSSNDKTIVCPVPLFVLRRWRRGFNQAEEIAKKLSLSMGVDYLSVLKRTKRTKQQALIKTDLERKKNVRNAFKARYCDLTGYHVYLVDDVKRSGATMTECAKILRNMGASKIYATLVSITNTKNHKLQSK